ncbi:MAG: response regulator [Pseudomonadota bacterium]
MATSQPVIVLVDDSDAMHAFFEQVAQETDIDLKLFRSAEDAMPYLSESRPDLLFLNIIMPNKDGFTFLQELRREPLHESTSTLMISSKDYAQDRSTAKDLGVLEFVAKPISKKALKSLIEKYALD